MYHPQNHQAQNYQAYAAAAMTTSKLRQVIMLYDGMVRFMQQSAEAIKAEDYESRYNLVTKAIKISQALQGALDYQHGHDIANILYGYYASLELRMYQLQRTNDLALCDGIVKDLRAMREAWQNIETIENEEKAKSTVSPVALLNTPAPTPGLAAAGVGFSA